MSRRERYCSARARDWEASAPRSGYEPGRRYNDTSQRSRFRQMITANIIDSNPRYFSRREQFRRLYTSGGGVGYATDTAKVPSPKTGSTQQKDNNSPESPCSYGIAKEHDAGLPSEASVSAIPDIVCVDNASTDTAPPLPAAQATSLAVSPLPAPEVDSIDESVETEPPASCSSGRRFRDDEEQKSWGTRRLPLNLEFRDRMSPGLSSQESESEGSSSSTKSHEIVTEVGQKELFIDHLMNYFYQMFPFYRSYSPYSQAASDVTHDPGVNTGVKDTANLTSNSTSNIQSFAAARKRSRFDGNEEEDEDDMAGNGQAKKAKLTGLEFDTRRLACPYFKKDPIRFQTEQSCCGPGWVTVHRMKEHLDRRHRLPISCLRCYAAFNTEAERDSHMRSLTQCEIKQPPPPIEGFNASQRAKLKTRPRDLKGMSEPGKWRRVYSILFPDTPGDEIPSPYYEFQNSKDLSWHVDPVMQYEQFLERELPLRVRQRLELRIEGALDPVQEALRGELVEIVHDVQLELYHDFTTSSRSDYVQSSSEIRSNDMCSGTQIQSCAIEPRREPVLSLDQDIQNVDTLNVPSDNPLAAWCPLPYVDWDSEDPELFSFGEITTLPTGTQDTDSAYGTMFSTGNVDQSIKMD